MNYETLLMSKEAENIEVIDRCFNSNNIRGLYCNGTIALKKGMTSTEKACVLAEELGHHHTTVGNILDQSIAENRKQERRARLWAYKKAFDLIDLVSAYKHGCRNRYEIAEFLEVTEQFLQEAINTYKGIYGAYTTVDQYVVYFEPLGILKVYK